MDGSSIFFFFFFSASPPSLLELLLRLGVVIFVASVLLRFLPTPHPRKLHRLFRTSRWFMHGWTVNIHLLTHKQLRSVSPHDSVFFFCFVICVGKAIRGCTPFFLCHVTCRDALRKGWTVWAECKAGKERESERVVPDHINPILCSILLLESPISSPFLLIH